MSLIENSKKVSNKITILIKDTADPITIEIGIKKNKNKYTLSK